MFALSLTMSQSTDAQEIGKAKKHKKHRHRSNEKSELKRKHKTSEHIELSSPTKKQRHESRSKSPSADASKRVGNTIDSSPFHQHTSSFYLPLAPIAQRHPIQGLCAEHLSPLLLTYYPPFHGVIISFSNPRCSEFPHNSSSTDGRQKAYARSVDEYAANFIWLTAEFLIFRPQAGNVIEGFINLQNEGNIGLVCWNFFSASIERNRLPKDWRWVPGGMSMGKRKKKLKGPSPERGIDVEEDNASMSKKLKDAEGYFQDANGVKIEGNISFRVKDVDTSGSMHRENGFLSIYGTLLDSDEEREILRREQSSTGISHNVGSDVRGHFMSGALTNGDDGAMVVDNIRDVKHRKKY